MNFFVCKDTIHLPGTKHIWIPLMIWIYVWEVLSSGFSWNVVCPDWVFFVVFISVIWAIQGSVQSTSASFQVLSVSHLSDTLSFDAI